MKVLGDPRRHDPAPLGLPRRPQLRLRGLGQHPRPAEAGRRPAGEIYDKLQRLSFRFFDANTTGSIITRVTGDVQSVRMFVDQVLIQSVIMVISLTVYAIYMASLSPGLTVACLATTPCPLDHLDEFSRGRSSRSTPRTEPGREDGAVPGREHPGHRGHQGLRPREGEPEKFEKLPTTLGAHPAVQHLLVGEPLLADGGLPHPDQHDRAPRLRRLAGRPGDRLPLGAGLVVFAGLLDQFSGQVNNVATIVNSVQQSLIGARRVFEILDAPIEVKNAPGRRAPRPKLEGAVRFENVSFEYGKLASSPTAVRPRARSSRHQPRGEARPVRRDPRAPPARARAC
jgi:ATP-binding cassette subfamily B protein